MWTKEQLEAINITDVNTTVSASAGAGKTAVLVERLMKRIIKDGVSVDRIVSLTFTDAAAAEMKNRLMKSLLEAYEKDQDNDYLYEQITLLPSANISTIHSYCLSLLKDHYYVLNLNPEALNNIIDEADDLSLHSEAFNYVLEHFDKEKSAEVMQLISGSSMSINRLNMLIKDLITTANGTINPEQFLRDSIRIYKKHEHLNDIPEPFLSMFWTYHTIKLNEFKDVTYQLLYKLDDVDESRDTSSHREWLNAVLNYITDMEKDISIQNYDDYVNTFEALASIPNKTITKEKEFNDLRSNYYDVLTTLAEIMFTQEELLAQLVINQKPLEYLIDMAIMYNQYYKEGIRSLNKITFNDMETLTYELLMANDQEIAKEVSKTISDILVDEFQDTNQLQDEIIKLISNGHNIFRVGDVKQSIYRFRGAEPEIMQSLISQADSDKHRTIYLSNNFRSKESIVQYNNHFFSHLMNLPSFNASYLENDVVKAGTPQQQEDSVPVELHRINVAEESDDDYINSLNNNERKAHYIASKIVELYDASESKKWNRFTVLVNSHSRKLELKAAFDKANIPYFIALPDGLYTSAGVSSVVAYLKLVYNPSDKISLMAVLVNLYHYTENQITELFMKLDEDLLKVANTLDENIMKQVYEFHHKQFEIPISEIVNYVLALNNFYEEKLSKQNRTNLDIFYDTVVQYDNNNVGIYALLKQIELAHEAKTKEGSSISSEDNVVNVMTIHNSKGLQFETVFLLSKEVNRSPQLSQGYILHPKYGLALKSIDLQLRSQSDNLAYFLIKYFDEKEALEEEMRKLYVALTRAQKELYIVDSIALKEDEPHTVMPFNDLEVAKSSYTKWMESVHHHHPDQTLVYKIEDSLQLRAGESIITDTRQIRHLQPFEIEKETSLNNFKAQTLSFDQTELATDLGTLVHNTMEKIDLNNINPDTIREISPDLNPYYINRILDLKEDAFFKDLLTKKVHREYPFIVNIKGRRQRGIIDFFVEDEQNVYIIDFKTDSLEEAQLFKDRYEKQLLFYTEALSQFYPNKLIHTYIYSFKLQSFIKIV